MPPLAYVVMGAAWQVAPLWVLACCSVQMQRLQRDWLSAMTPEHR